MTKKTLVYADLHFKPFIRPGGLHDDHHIPQCLLPPPCASTTCLHGLQHLLLELAVLDLLARVIRRGLTVEREQIAEIELGSFEELDFADVDLNNTISTHKRYQTDELNVNIHSAKDKSPAYSSQSPAQ